MACTHWCTCHVHIDVHAMCTLMHMPCAHWCTCHVHIDAHAMCASMYMACTHWCTCHVHIDVHGMCTLMYMPRAHWCTCHVHIDVHAMCTLMVHIVCTMMCICTDVLLHTFRTIKCIHFRRTWKFWFISTQPRARGNPEPLSWKRNRQTRSKCFHLIIFKQAQ